MVICGYSADLVRQDLRFGGCGLWRWVLRGEVAGGGRDAVGAAL
jgi:hypothetical protein